MMSFVGENKFFGGEMSCLAEMLVHKADCMKSFKNVSRVLTNACYQLILFIYLFFITIAYAHIHDETYHVNVLLGKEDITLAPNINEL